MGLLPDAAETRALLSLVLLAVGTALALYALKNPRWEVPATTAATGGLVGWTLTSSAYDGPVVFVVVGSVGLHAGDLLSIPAGLLVLWLCWRGVRH